VQGLLFDQEDRQKQARLDAVADGIKERFGAEALRRASSVGHQDRTSSGRKPKG